LIFLAYKLPTKIKHGLRPGLIRFCIQSQSGYFIGLNNYAKSNIMPKSAFICLIKIKELQTRIFLKKETV